MLERVGLGGAGKRRVGDYSLGMRQRLGIGTALMGDPAVLILDEPANGMDPEGIRWMRMLLHDFAAGGGTVLLSSHLLAEAQATVDRLVVIGRRPHPRRRHPRVPPGRAGDDGPGRRPHRARPGPAHRRVPDEGGIGRRAAGPGDGRAGRARRPGQPPGPARAARRRQLRAGGALLRAHRDRDRDRRRPGHRGLIPDQHPQRPTEGDPHDVHPHPHPAGNRAHERGAHPPAPVLHADVGRAPEADRHPQQPMAARVDLRADQRRARLQAHPVQDRGGVRQLQQRRDDRRGLPRADHRPAGDDVGVDRSAPRSPRSRWPPAGYP